MQLEASYHRGGACSISLAPLVFVLQWQVTNHQRSCIISCVVCGLLDSCARWVSIELNSLIFKFFWSGKLDLVPHRMVVQHRSLEGFSVVDFQSKVSALLVQWVPQFVVSPAPWVFFMSFWFSSVLGCLPQAVFSSPGSFTLSGLPPFYCSVVSAWLSCGGSSRGPSLGIGRGVTYRPIHLVTTKSAHLLLLSELSDTPPLCCSFPPFIWSLVLALYLAPAFPVWP